LIEDYDYKAIRAILEDELLKVHNIAIHYQWVQGRQDTKPILDKEGMCTLLSKAAKININCDKPASRYRRNPNKERRPHNKPIIPTEAKVYLSSKGQINIGILEDHIMIHRHGEKIEKKLKDKFNWSSEKFQRIDWHNHGEVVRKQDRIKYLNIAKSIYGWQAVNKNQHSWHKETNPIGKCPTCGKYTETQEHVFQFPILPPSILGSVEPGDREVSNLIKETEIRDIFHLHHQKKFESMDRHQNRTGEKYHE